jgi:hypothetical protein
MSSHAHAHALTWLPLLRLLADRFARRLRPAARRMRRISNYRCHSTEWSSRATYCNSLLLSNCSAGRAWCAPWRHFHLCPSARLLLLCSPCWLHHPWSAQPAHCMLASDRAVLRKQLCGGTAAAWGSCRAAVRSLSAVCRGHCCCVCVSAIVRARSLCCSMTLSNAHLSTGIMSHRNDPLLSSTPHRNPC